MNMKEKIKAYQKMFTEEEYILMDKKIRGLTRQLEESAERERTGFVNSLIEENRKLVSHNRRLAISLYGVRRDLREIRKKNKQ